MEINTKHKTYNDIDYDNDYDKIFENNSLELNEQTLPIDKLNS